MINSPRKK